MRRPPWLAPTLLVTGVLLAAAGTGSGAFLASDGSRPELVLPRFGDGRDRARFDPAERPEPLSPVVDFAFRVVGALLVLAIAGFVLFHVVRGLRRLRRMLRGEPPGLVVPPEYDPGDAYDDDDAEPLRRRIRRELDLLALDLDQVGEAREVVIACYARMEALAAAAGTPRRPAETPAEFVARVLSGHRLPEPAVRRLAALFEEARFSDHRVDDAMRVAARIALADVRGALEVRA